MNESDHNQEAKELSRQQAAERLTDIAYALTAGGRLRVDNDDEVDLALAGRMRLKRERRSRNGRVELEIELSWAES
jgi:amphi-Trp domain-containing protein